MGTQLRIISFILLISESNVTGRTWGCYLNLFLLSFIKKISNFPISLDVP